MADTPQDRITVFAGEEKFSPVQYHSFAIGGYSYTTTIRGDETPEEAFTRAWSFLSQMKRNAFAEARADFYARLKGSQPTNEEIGG